MKKRFAAFTLAEVLITLGIIGIVAAMTLPALIANYQKQETIAKLQKTYSIINQAIKLSELDNGEYDVWPKAADINVNIYFNQYWKPYYKGAKLCMTTQHCGYVNGGYIWKNFDGLYVGWVIETSDTRFLFQIADGTVIFVPRNSADISGNPSYVNYIYIDLNGPKNPNILGKDVFMFSLENKKGLVPYCREKTISEINNLCKINSTGNYNCCVDKIIRDGWKIKDDYPW